MEQEFAGTYPIFIDGAQTGEVRVSRDGLFWLFDARCDEREELVRLSVFGGGEEGYLGLLSPEDGALRLKKRLSSAAVGAFPQRIEYAAPRGCPLPEPEPEAIAVEEESAPPPEDSIPPPNDIVSPPCEEFPDNSVPVSPQRAPDEDAFADNSPSPPSDGDNLTNNSPPEAFFRRYSGSRAPHSCDVEDNSAILSPHAQQWHSCPLPCSLFTDVEAKGAAGGIRGAMSCSFDGCTRLAVPLSEAHAIGRRSVLRFDESAQIGGRTYVVCKIKNGKPI